MSSSEIVPSSKATTTQIEQVFKWLIEGHSAGEIQEAIAAKFPGVKSQPMILAAMRRLSRAGQVDPRIAKGWAIENLREIGRRSLESSDFGSAIRATMAIVKLAGTEQGEGA